MKLWSDTLKDGAPIHPRFAFGKPDPHTHVALSDNLNPHLAWSGVPAEARSLAIIMVDPDVPSKPDDVNQEGRTVPLSLPRVPFYHLVLVDLPVDQGEIKEGSLSDGVTPRGKAGPETKGDFRHGLNDFTGWFAGSEDMDGQYFGYDGPCPPWNDEALHHYHISLYALDVETLKVEGAFTGPEVLKAMGGHILAEAKLTGTYAIFKGAQPRG